MTNIIFGTVASLIVDAGVLNTFAALNKVRTSIFILTTVAFLLSTFSKGLILVDYYTNPGRFAKSCENKARPKMHCNGKCQVMKKMSQEENKDKQNNTKKQNEDIICSRGPLPKLPRLPACGPVKYVPRNNKNTADHSGSNFQPPEA
jgi:hypothetical protein